MADKTFPHFAVNVYDVDGVDDTVDDSDSLHNPVFLTFAEQGPVGIPIYGAYDNLIKTVGENTFDVRGKYFTHQAMFAMKAAAIQPIWFIRLATDDATISTLVLELVVEKTSLTQYEKDSLNGRQVDESGNYIPRTKADGITTLTEDGYKLTWNTRALASGEDYDSIQPVEVASGGVVVKTTYPIVAIQMKYPGSYGNLRGFSLYYTDDASTDIQSSIGALTFRFAPIYRTDDSETPLPVRNTYSDRYSDVALMADAFDSGTSRYVSLPDVIKTEYTDFPYDVHVYSSYVGIVGQKILDVSPELSALNAYQLNIMSGVDADGHLYDHFEIDETDVKVNANVYLYMQGGSDGTLSEEAHASLVTQYLSGDVYPEINDQLHYPFTHFYDSGFPLATKLKFLQLFTLRDDIKLEFCTQDLTRSTMNTQAEDQSTGSALRASITLYPESSLYNTGAFRAAIYQQVGKLAGDTTYRKYLPLSLDRLIKRCTYEGGTTRKGTPAGRPASEVSLFDISTVNWKPTTSNAKQLSWETGLNYVQHCNRTTLFYAALRSVHKVDSSILSSDTFADQIVYMKHIAGEVWTIYAGMGLDPATLTDVVGKQMDERFLEAFPDANVKTTVTQTAKDKKLGYSSTATVTVKGFMDQRILNVNMAVGKES